MNKYQERLTKEWIEHGKIIIAVDYDSTISPYHTIDNSEDIQRCIKLLQDAHYTGAYIVINTACNHDRYEEIQKYCEGIKLPIDAINKTPLDLPYGKTGKVYANLYLDDRAGFIEAMNLLEACMYQVRGQKETNKQLDDVA